MQNLYKMGFRKVLLYLSVLTQLGITSCDEMPTNKEFQPIVLGDSSTIVIETNPEYLKNEVEDIAYGNNDYKIDTPVVTSEKETSNLIVKDTTPVAAKNDKETATTNVANVSGLNIHIGNETYINIDGATIKEYKKQDATKASELIYKIVKGTPQQIEVKIQNGKINTAQYRYTSLATIHTNGKTIALNSLGQYTSGWSKLTTNNSATAVPTIKNITFKNIKGNDLKSAVQKELQARRYKSSAISSITSKIGSKTTINKSPFTVTQTSTGIRLIGTDAKGKNFDKVINFEH
jgi:hypothetical protein